MQINKILIVEDEKEIADTLHYALSTEGFSVNWVSTAQQALDALENEPHDFAILDVGLPDLNGFELLKQLRKQTKTENLPVLVLTARSEEIDRVVGFEIGADDYVCKPFSPREVVARVKAILKRTQSKHSTPTQKPQQQDFVHKHQSNTISYQSKVLDLTRSEYSILAALLEQPDRVFSRRQLIEAVWSEHHPSDDRVIDTHIKSLRAKLRSRNPHKQFIKTQRGFGYSFER